MSVNRANLEVIAPTIEEAIAKGLADLGLAEEDVDVDILDQGSRGLFGLGSRQARIRLTIKESSRESGNTGDLVEDELDIHMPVGDEGVEPQETQAGTQYAEQIDRNETLRVAREVVEDLLDKMHMRALVEAHFVEPEDERSRSRVWVDVLGKDLSILIGPRAETLNALQYIAGLIISKELNHAIPLVVDVEGYRSRRVQQLRQLARRMADQAIKTGRRQVLEPMPADERRIIHIELRSNPQVKTESIDEDPRRKVTISPK